MVCLGSYPVNNIFDLLRYSGRKQFKTILQTEASECGLACIAMVAYYYGFKTDLNSLRQKNSVSLKGATLNSLMSIAANLNLASRALRIDLDEIKNVAKPAILHWKMNHFVVFKKVTRKGLIIIDPAFGERCITKEEFSDCFTGIVLELIPTNNFEVKNEERQLKFNQLWESIHGIKSSLVKVLLLSLILQVYGIVSPFYMQLVVDEVIVSHDQSLLATLAIGFVLLLIINITVTVLRSLVVLYLSTQLNLQITNNLLYHLIRLPLEWYEKRHIGDVISRFGSLEQIKQLLTTGIIEAIVDGLMMIGTLVMMYLYSPKLAWIVLLTLSLYIILRWILYKPLRVRSEQNIVNKANTDSNFIETIRAIQTVKIFGKENQRQSEWQNLYADTLNSSIQLTKLGIVNKTTNSILFGFENILVIYLAAQNVLDGLMSVGMLYAFMSYKSQFTSKATALVDKFVQFKMLNLHLSRIADIVHTKIEKSYTSSLIDSDIALTGDLCLKNIKFRYSANEPYILNNINLQIKSGESIAIIGTSGCGKTTLMKIMLGLLQPESGSIEVDSKELNKIGIQSYRKSIAAVMQEDQLLSGTLAENICFSDLDYNQTKIESCAKIAAIHNDIMNMPMAYHSLVGDMGSSLSGGQKQRVILARAIYTQPKILFLDEATSHLDTKVEGLVNKSIRYLKMTKIIIAHREETIRSAERVFEMKKGELIEVSNDYCRH